MSFLRNVWYVAALPAELPPGKLLARRLLNTPLVFFRDAGGEARAIMDRCPHRFAPLSMGQLCDGEVQCAYHGLRFDGQGQCVHNPHSDVIPIAARVPTYPLVERHALLWIWLGDPARADASTIPDFYCRDQQRRYIGDGYLHVKADYRLENDNILDLSHIQYLHPGTLGSKRPGEGRTEVIQQGNTIWSKRAIRDEILTDFLNKAHGIEGDKPIDRWIDVRWDPPSCMLLQQDVALAGQPRPQGTPHSISTHIFTPETEFTTHYWFSHCLDKETTLEGQAAADRAIRAVEVPFREEDLPMLEAVQKNMEEKDFWQLKPVLLAPDAPAVRVRRLLDKLIAAEQHGEAVSI